MAAKQPNTICKHRNCTRGKDGGRKHYYTCRYCARTANWRSVACCEECYQAYMKQVAQARGLGDPPDVLPDRTDMTKEEVRVLVTETPLEDVVRETQEELADEIAASPGMDIGQIVDQINKQLDEEGGA